MGFRLIEGPDGIETSESPPSYTQTYTAHGSVSASYVRSYVRGATPSIVSTQMGTLYRQDVALRQAGYNRWRVRVPYGPRKNESGDWTWDFDTTGGTVHITHAKEEVARYPDGEAPNQYGAISVEGDQVKGTDKIIPALKINVQYQHPLGAITIPQAKFLASITGTTNSDTFLGFAPGEVLFLGARGSDGSSAETMVNYQFAMSSNATLSIGEIVDIAKKGWELVWTSYEDAEETEGGVTLPIRKPKFVYVDRVYDQTAMSAAFGFG